MPRNGSGVYSLPAGNPVVTATTIQSTWANSTLNDVSDALTGSVARDGSGGMTGALRLADGSIAIPGVAFSAETTTGFSRPATNVLVGSVGGLEKFRLNASGASVTGTLGVSAAATFSTTLAVTGAATFSTTLAVTGAATLSSTLAVTGTTTLTGAATLTANPTLSAGTANGVLYLDGSKVATSGSALTFDGTNLGITGTTTLSALTASTALALNASKNVVSVTNTGTGDNVLATNPVLVTPALGTPQSGVLTNCTSIPVANATGTLPIANGGTGSTATAYCALGSNVSGTLPVANGGTGVTSSTGTGSTVLSTSPVLVTPSLGTPTALTLTSATGLPLTTGVTGTLPIANGGTGSTSTTYCALGSNVSGTLPVANGGTGVTSSTGTGSTVLSISPTLTTPALGAATATTPSAGANGTGVATTAFVQNRAWVRFDGTQIAANMINASWNVSSITDNGTGNYTLNFGTAMADANFCAVVSINNASAVSLLVQPYVTTPTVNSSVQVLMLETGGGNPADTAGTHVAVFR